MAIKKGEVAFITGAASGHGRVVIVDLNEDAGKAYAEELNKKAGSAVAISAKADTTKFEEQLAAYELAKEKFGRIDYVFANAGIAELPWLTPGPARSVSDALSQPITPPNLATVNIDLIGQLNTAALALQIFERQEKNELGLRGKLILTASVFGYYPCASMPMYATAKAGIVNFMRSAAVFFKARDVTVNCSMCYIPPLSLRSGQ
ncbi:NAD-P-binding protein [Stereum hirsutum FP-91666 SS1]|uniref:NAD-P-binding protein n=1 Tax=Stereum hirsutum (strain FP-91666) TaxID=721885 RepID=R7RVV1_STEHR|nr:NAD-P-binding protein [Stereum hirsutum FP-91666 SS1]EIM79319.1 NAD-P-binding protein [Stereum hirsutum FP-91666 SS1]